MPFIQDPLYYASHLGPFPKTGSQPWPGRAVEAVKITLGCETQETSGY